MTRDEACAKAQQALDLLAEIHANRHQLGRLNWNPKQCALLAHFATTDAVTTARRVVGLFSDAPVPEVSHGR